jgi:hypothetical protein
VGDCELELAFTSDGAPREIEAGRDGWTASGSAVAVSATNGTSAWLSTSIDGEPIDVVRWRAGRVEIGWRSMDEPRGDAAAFAVSWAQLFDAALLPQRGVVALDERRSAGAASQRAPERPVGAQSGATRAAAVLTALAALLALAALALRR